jgi:ABC-type transporter Mla maintaining outer membrane lipid asymmetry ATPase subunit MlaF
MPDSLSSTAAGTAFIEMRGAFAVAMRDADSVVAESVDWTVNQGDFWVLAGVQGSGKSDFLMMTGGIMPPMAGYYQLFGEEMPIYEDSHLETRLRLGVVFDGGQLFNQLTILENVALPLSYHRDMNNAQAQTRAMEILSALELSDLAERRPGSVGRNWQQRAGLARALALQPELLLVDSPLTGLDLLHSRWWLSFLDQLAAGHPLLQQRPVTLVVTADDLRPWKGHATQFAVLKDKRLATLGTWSQLEAASRELVGELLTLGKPTEKN